MTLLTRIIPYYALILGLLTTGLRWLSLPQALPMLPLHGVAM